MKSLNGSMFGRQKGNSYISMELKCCIVTESGSRHVLELYFCALCTYRQNGISCMKIRMQIFMRLLQIPGELQNCTVEDVMVRYLS